MREFVSTRKQTLLILVLFLAEPLTAHSSQGSEIFLHLERVAQRFWILPRKPLHAMQPYMLRFAFLPSEYSGSAKLEVRFELPDGHQPRDVVYRVSGSIEGWPIRDYAYWADEYLEIYLPALEAGRPAEISIGWIGAPFDESRAYALLTTDGSQAIQQWVGWRLK